MIPLIPLFTHGILKMKRKRKSYMKTGLMNCSPTDKPSLKAMAQNPEQALKTPQRTMLNLVSWLSDGPGGWWLVKQIRWSSLSQGDVVRGVAGLFEMFSPWRNSGGGQGVTLILLRAPPVTHRVGRCYKALFDLAQCAMSSLQAGLAKTVTGSALKYWPINKVWLAVFVLSWILAFLWKTICTFT